MTADCDDTVATAFVQTGSGVTVSTVEARGGQSTIQAAATITSVNVYRGVCTLEGDFQVTTLNAYGGIARPNNVRASGSEIATVNVDGGEVDGAAITQDRTWDTVNLKEGGGSLRGNSSLTITTLNEPTAGDYALANNPL